LLFGNLNLNIEALRVIEDGSSSPEEMQKNMGVADECGNRKTTRAKM
jgi:bacterioferritin-associated ferredoxin